jgi:hypothetical protein
MAVDCHKLSGFMLASTSHSRQSARCNEGGGLMSLRHDATTAEGGKTA